MRTLPSLVFVTMPWATMYSGLECGFPYERPFPFAALTTAFARECGKCDSRSAASASISSGSRPSTASTCSTVGMDFVSVPVLSNTMVSASLIISRYFPPFTVMWCAPASLIAESTAIGIATSIAHEKSTISTDAAFVTFLVSSSVTRAVPNVYGIRLLTSFLA